MVRLRVYSRKGCHLCEVLLETLLPMVRGTFEVEVVDIDTQPEWLDRYGSRIPVVEFDGRMVCQYELDRQAIIELLEQARDTGAE